jgi:hypothetical protein
MAIELVFESHSTTVDNEQGRATGWLPSELSPWSAVSRRPAGALGRSASPRRGTRRHPVGLEHFIGGATLEDLAGQEFIWRAGWK